MENPTVATTSFRADGRFTSIKTCSPVMEEVFASAESLAKTDVPILIEGETGTGKELTAHLIHDLSPRAGNPFVALNISALSKDLFVAELFGHAKGAFTGADESRAGFLERAGEGTIFLDEIGDLSWEHQDKLLRLLDNDRFFRVGDPVERQSRARIVMATNRDLWQAVEEKRFREDLYYRLSAHPITLPPLRDRLPGDIDMLADHFLEMYGQRFNVGEKTLSPEALQILIQYSFPGNVRELEGMIRHAVIVTEGPVIDSSSFPAHVRNGERNRRALQESIQSARVRAIVGAVTACDGNKTRAAEHLGIARSTLYLALKQCPKDRTTSSEKSDS